MAKSPRATRSGTITVAVEPQPDGSFVCEISSQLPGQNDSAKRFHGQNSNHAIAVALENLARSFRMQAEAEQSIDWHAVDRSPSGQVIDKRFHVILHYERDAEDETKFDAMVNTMMGNAVVENAEISIIQVDAALPVKPLTRIYKDGHPTEPPPDQPDQ